MGRRIASISGFPGYSVDTDGNVYSAWTRAAGAPGKNGRGAVLTDNVKLLKPSKQNDGRTLVRLSRSDGERVNCRVSHLVLDAFVGPRPNGCEACHFPDRDPSNNRLSNLRWDTKSSNQGDRVAHGTSNHGTRNGAAKLTSAEVDEIRHLHKGSIPQREIAAMFVVSRSNIQQICSGTTWPQETK